MYLLFFNFGLIETIFVKNAVLYVGFYLICQGQFLERQSVLYQTHRVGVIYTSSHFRHSKLVRNTKFQLLNVISLYLATFLNFSNFVDTITTTSFIRFTSCMPEILELRYVDNTMIIADLDDLKRLVEPTSTISSKYRLKVNRKKTKYMNISKAVVVSRWLSD